MTQIDSAFDQVVTQIQQLNQFADTTLSKAMSALDAIVGLQVPELTARGDYEDQDLDGVTRPSALPALENVSLQQTPDVPEFAARNVRAVVVPGGEPVEPPDPTTPIFVDAPVLVDPALPTAPVLAPLGDAPTYDDNAIGIPFPELYEITLPEVPTIDFSSVVFAGQRPVFTGQDLDESLFAYSDEAYVGQLTSDLRNNILAMLNGERGLPAAVEAALYQRAREREQEAIDRAIEEANEEWAARGFSMPPGPLNARADRLRQEGNAKISQLNRDQYIEAWRIQIEQYKFALAQGLAFEDLYVRMHIERQNRRLQAARFAVDLAISVYNAKVARFQAEASLYETDARVYRERLQALLAQVQVYAEQVRAQQLVGELNQQLVQVYSERVRTVLANVELFRARLDGYRTSIDAQRAVIDRYRAEIEAAQAVVATNTARVQQYTATISAESAKLDTFRVRADVYSSKVQAWAQRVNAAIETSRTDAQALAAEADAYRAQIGGIAAVLDKERTRIASISENNQRRLQGYQAEIAGTTSYNSTLIERTRARIANAQANAEIEVQNANINVTNATNLYNLLVRGRETVAQVLAQLGAGAMSAANVGASISGSSGYSTSVGFNYSGTVPDGQIIRG